jgi:hypothetical protein
MKCFKSPRQVQWFLSIHDQVANVFTRRPNQDPAAKFSFRAQSGIHHRGRGHRRGDGCVIAPRRQWSSDRRAFRYPVDDKLTVPLVA